MTKSNEDTLDPVTNDDSLSESPRESIDPLTSEAKTHKPKRKRAKKVMTDGK